MIAVSAIILHFPSSLIATSVRANDASSVIAALSEASGTLWESAMVTVIVVMLAIKQDLIPIADLGAAVGKY